jgi:hypothetical protein
LVKRSLIDFAHESSGGFYLLVGPDWKGEMPTAITKVFSLVDQHRTSRRASRKTTHPKTSAIKSVLPGIMMYPLSMFDGTMKTKDWVNLTEVPAPLNLDSSRPLR